MLIPTTKDGRDLATLSAGLLAAHLRDDIESFQEASSLFDSCGQMIQGLLFLSSLLASDIAERLDVDPEVVARSASLTLQGFPEPAS